MTKNNFMQLVEHELEIPITESCLTKSLDSLENWDSFHVVSLLVLLEEEYNISLTLTQIAECNSLSDLLNLCTDKGVSNDFR